MKKILSAVLFLAAPAVHAEQWQILGTRPMGMGGAFVAVAQGPIAQYWNPAGLVKSSSNVSGLEVPAGVNAEFTGNILERASQIGDLAAKYSAIQAAQTGGGAVNADQMAAFVKTLSLLGDMNGKGALVEVAGGVNFKFSKVALSVNNLTSVGLSPFIDTTNIGLDAASGLSGIDVSAVSQLDTLYDTAETKLNSAITTLGYGNVNNIICGSANCLNTEQSIGSQATFVYALINKAIADGLTEAQINEAAIVMALYAADVKPLIAAASSGASYSNNTSNLTVAGAAFFEVAAGYAWYADKWLDGLSVGGNLKLINGRTTAVAFRFLSEGDTADAFKIKEPNSSWQPAVDLGVLWDVSRKYPGLSFHPKVGLVMRNVNSPSFASDAAGDYHLNRQARLGFALNPAKFWTLALDVDVTKNRTPLKGFKSRQLAMGIEINLFHRRSFNIPLRMGLLRNLAEQDSKVAYTIGTGLNLLHMHFDISGINSSNTTEIDGTDYPVRAGLAASFGLLF